MFESKNKTSNSRLIMANFAMMLFVALVAGLVLGPVFADKAVIMLVALLLCLFAVFVLNLFANKLLNYIVTYVTSAVLGTTAYSSLLFYVGALGSDVVIAVIGVCLIVFTLCAILGYKADYDFSSWGNILFFATVGLIIFGVISIFIFPGNLIMMISGAFGVAIFIGYTIYDFSLLSNSEFADEDVPVMAFSIFLNLFNLILQALKALYYLFELLTE